MRKSLFIAVGILIFGIIIGCSATRKSVIEKNDDFPKWYPGGGEDTIIFDQVDGREYMYFYGMDDSSTIKGANKKARREAFGKIVDSLKYYVNSKKIKNLYDEMNVDPNTRNDITDHFNEIFKSESVDVSFSGAIELKTEYYKVKRYSEKSDYPVLYHRCFIRMGIPLESVNKYFQKKTREFINQMYEE